MNFIHTILVPHDFSDHAEASLDLASSLALALGARLHLLHVVQPPAYAYGSELYAGGPIHGGQDAEPGLHRECERQLEEIAARHPEASRGIETHVVEGTRIAETIDDTAARLHADLIVMGTHGRTGLAHLLLGSVAEATLRQAPCPVLTVPGHRRAPVAGRRALAWREPALGAL